MNQHARQILQGKLTEERYALSHDKEVVVDAQIALDRARQAVTEREQRIAFLEEALGERPVSDEE